jgi:hypothetical protein
LEEEAMTERDGPFAPCFVCGSTGDCAHLATVLNVAGNPPIPVRALGGLREAQETAARVCVQMAARALGLVEGQAGEGEGALVLVGFLALAFVLILLVCAGVLRVPDWPLRLF